MNDITPAQFAEDVRKYLEDHPVHLSFWTKQADARHAAAAVREVFPVVSIHWRNELQLWIVTVIKLVR